MEPAIFKCWPLLQDEEGEEQPGVRSDQAQVQHRDGAPEGGEAREGCGHRGGKGRKSSKRGTVVSPTYLPPKYLLFLSILCRLHFLQIWNVNDFREYLNVNTPCQCHNNLPL